MQIYDAIVLTRGTAIQMNRDELNRDFDRNIVLDVTRLDPSMTVGELVGLVRPNGCRNVIMGPVAVDCAVTQ